MLLLHNEIATVVMIIYFFATLRSHEKSQNFTNWSEANHKSDILIDNSRLLALFSKNCNFWPSQGEKQYLSLIST